MELNHTDAVEEKVDLGKEIKIIRGELELPIDPKQSAYQLGERLALITNTKTKIQGYMMDVGTLLSENEMAQSKLHDMYMKFKMLKNMADGQEKTLKHIRKQE